MYPFFAGILKTYKRRNKNIASISGTMILYARGDKI